MSVLIPQSTQLWFSDSPPQRLGKVHRHLTLITILSVGAAGSFIADQQRLLLGYGFSLPLGRKGVLHKGTAYRLCLLAGLFSSVGRASAYKAESRGFESRRSPLFLPLSFHHSDYTAVSFSPSYTNQAGLGLVAPDFINHFVD